MMPSRRVCSGAAALAYLVLLLPPVRRALEASMTAQMLLQIPLLVGVGLLLGAALPARVRTATSRWNAGGISGLLLASLAASLWLLPRILDSAVTQPLADAARYLCAPLLIGVPFALSWPRMSFIVRGVFVLECVATLFRMGWLYLAWPARLCNSFLLDDQRRLGQYLLLAGIATCLLIAFKLLGGSFGSLQQRQSAPAERLPPLSSRGT